MSHDWPMLDITEEQYNLLEDKLLRAASVDDLLNRLRDSISCHLSPESNPDEALLSILNVLSKVPYPKLPATVACRRLIIWSSDGSIPTKVRNAT